MSESRLSRPLKCFLFFSFSLSGGALGCQATLEFFLKTVFEFLPLGIQSEILPGLMSRTRGQGTNILDNFISSPLFGFQWILVLRMLQRISKGKVNSDTGAVIPRE